MVNQQVKKEHVTEALKLIDKNGVPKNRNSTKYNLYYGGKSYPPKYVLSVATKIASGKELDPSVFNGGKETNSFLNSLSFTIREGNIEVKKVKSRSISICSVLIQIQKRFKIWESTDNKIKFNILEQILKRLYGGIDILILPAGFVNSKGNSYKTILKPVKNNFKKLLAKLSPSLIVCFGIDGKFKSEQFAAAICSKGFLSLARKFHHMNDSVSLAKTPFEKENRLNRFFNIEGKTAYMAVCYDVFGINQQKVTNKGFDFIISPVHGFGNGGGDSDFARKGLAGAAKQWKVHIYASAVFADNRNAKNWTAGVQWTHGNASVRDFKYEDIKLDAKSDVFDTSNAKIYLRYYKE